MTVYRLSQQTSTKTFPHRWVTMVLLLTYSLLAPIAISQAQKAGNLLTIQNDSGQFVLVKTVGPTKAVAKIPLDQKKRIRLAPGDYYLLVRFGFAPKEYIYTKGETFTVRQEEETYSRTMVTLHRIVSGMDNPHEVTGEEFENYQMSEGKKNTAEKHNEAKE
ncbi:MAG: hypothetical protein O2999_08660 [Nitrospirae bacterium]|nr:hypothetical protein [Nitrospirota bacterium]MDA1304355.1 hypothetical protein [Nitrospirota bacterium]